MGQPILHFEVGRCRGRDGEGTKRLAALAVALTFVACSKTSTNNSAESTPSPAATPSAAATSNAVAPAPTIGPTSSAPTSSRTSASATRAPSALSDIYIVKTDSVVSEATFRVFVNGVQQGEYAAPNADSDITAYFHRGRNTLRVAWDGGDYPVTFGTLTVGQGRGGHFSTLLSIDAGMQVHERHHGQLAITVYAR